MKFIRAKGSTSNILTVFIQDSSSTTGAGLGSLDQTSSITGGYVREGGTGVALSVNEDVTTEGTYQAPTTAAQVRIGTPANMPTGFYELHFHNNLFASGADTLTIGLSGAANMAPLTLEVQLSDVDLNDGVRGGMTALPNAVADAPGGLAISDAGGLDLDGLNTNVSAILTDTGTTLDNHLTDIKGTGFVKDTHSLIDIETYVDLIDDGDKGLVKIAADVAAVLVDTTNLNDGAQAEPTAVPAANATLLQKVNWLFMLARNKRIMSDSTDKHEVYADDTTTLVATSSITDDSTATTAGEWTDAP